MQSETLTLQEERESSSEIKENEQKTRVNPESLEEQKENWDQ